MSAGKMWPVAAGFWVSGVIFLFAAILSNADMARFLAYMGLSAATSCAAWAFARRANRALLAEVPQRALK